MWQVHPDPQWTHQQRVICDLDGIAVEYRGKAIDLSSLDPVCEFRLLQFMSVQDLSRRFPSHKPI